MVYSLEITNLRKSFKYFTLQDLSFSLEKGYIMGFIGPNGSGKSTTIKLIMNLLREEGGEIKVFGMDHREQEKQIKERIGFVYDQNHFYEDLTLGNMKRVIAACYKNWEEATFQDYLRRFQLKERQKIRELSKGMKMKYSLALALSHGAELIIMDEPTSGLDPIVRSGLLEILQQVIQDENKAILFSTHITTDLDRIADFITFIHDGKLVFSRPKDEVLDEYRIIKGGNDILDDEVRGKLLGLREGRFGFEAMTNNLPQIRKALGKEILVEKPSLEEIMIYKVRGEAHV